MVDKDTQEKIDVVKTRLIKDYGYCEICANDVLQLCGQHLRARRREEVNIAPRRKDRQGMQEEILSVLRSYEPVLCSSV